MDKDKAVEAFYRQTNAKPLFKNQIELNKWSRKFSERLKPQLEENEKKRFESLQRAKNDIRWKGIV